MGKKKEELYQADLDLCNDVGPCFRFEQNKPKCSNCPLDKRLPANFRKSEAPKMRTPDEIKTEIARIQAQDTYKSGQKHPATIDINAPLALVQLEQETEIKTLRWVLNENERGTKKS